MNFLKSKKFLKLSAVALFILGSSFVFESCKKNDDQAPTPSPAKESFSGEDLYKGLFYSEGQAGKKLADINPHYVDLSGFYKTQEERNKVLAFENRIVEEIKSKYPDFFNTFKADLESGDPIVIQLAIRNAVKVNAEIIPAMPEVKDAFKSMTKAKEALGDVDFQQFVDENNKIDREGLEAYLKQKAASGENVNGGACLAIAEVAVIVIAVAVTTVVGIEFAFAVDFALVSSDVVATSESVTFSGGDSDGDSDGGGGEAARLSNSSLKEEILAAGIAERF